MHFHSFYQIIVLSTFPLNFLAALVLFALRLQVLNPKSPPDFVADLLFNACFSRVPKRLYRQGGCSSQNIW